MSGEPQPGRAPAFRPVTLTDVARAAGVHPGTVSRVLSGSPSLKVRPETRERVLRIASELQYRPNAVARGLRLSTVGALGLLVPSLRNPVFSQIIRGAFRRAWEESFVVVLAEDGNGEEATRAYERLVGEGRIDGLLVASIRPEHPLLDQAAERVATVYVNRRHPGGGQSVSMREEDAGALAARHLLELGHRRLAHIAGPAGLDTAERRARGFATAAAAAGVPVTVIRTAFDEASGHDAMRSLLDTPPPPTGVFVSNINQAVGALAGARTATRRVPHDVSLLTYDDDPVAVYLDPPLTAIRMPLDELGATAVDSLLDRIRTGSHENLTIQSPPELVHRGSTGPAPT